MFPFRNLPNSYGPQGLQTQPSFTQDLRQRFQDLRISPPLDLYLFPIKNQTQPPTQMLSLTNPPNPTSTDTWILLMSSPNNPSTNCTFLHVWKIRQGPGPIPGSPFTYISDTPRLNRPLSSEPFIAAGTCNLTQHKIGRVSSSQHDVVLRTAETATMVATNKMLPWVMIFLLALEEAGLVHEGTRTYYDRFVEPFWPEIEEAMRGLGIMAGREELVRRLREMGQR
ncbi:uncharacterized protein BDV17DRAFT_286309 [Aspergillus undulatus]|uniref:uncharacterized protein n=1 Tax=Aspergillus undulatus TaxID=1810928 RepID=UPI003CCD088E